LFRFSYTDGIVGKKGANYIAEVAVVGADNDRLGKLRGFENVVSTSRHERAADNGNVGE
jgi:hypothetical protein